MRRSPFRSRSSLLVALAVVAAAACSGGGDDAGGTDGQGTVTVEDPSSSTTEVPADDTTTSTAGAPGGDLVLRGDGLGVVDLGAAPDAAVAAVSLVLGEPTADSGWESSFGAYGTCPGERVRGVEWDHLVLLFTDGETPEGTGEHLFAWRVSGAPPAVATGTGFGYLATVEDAQQLYPGAVELVPAEDPFPAFLEVAADGGTITAFLDDLDQVTNLEAGAPCGE